MNVTTSAKGGSSRHTERLRARREYLAGYRTKNRDRYNAAHRRWRSSKYGPPATDGQKRACRKNPLASLQSKFGIVKPSFVLCMICWNRTGELGHHRCVKECGGREVYANNVGLPKKVPLWCERFSRAKSKVSKKKCTPHVRRYWKENPDALTGKAKPLTWKTSAKGDVVTDGMLVWAWVVEGRPIEKIAAQYRMGKASVMRRLRRILGFPIRRFCTVVHGEPVTKAWGRALVGRFSLRLYELCEALGRNRSFADNLTRSSRRSGMPRRATAQAVVRFERELMRELLRARRVSKPALLKAAVLDLDAKYRALFGPCSWLLSQSGNLKDNVSEICVRSRAESAAGGPFCWRAFLCWLPALVEFIADNPEWRTKWPTASRLATAFLANDLGTEQWVVSDALSDRTQPISADALSLLVRLALESVSKLPGRDPGADRLTQGRIKLAASYVKLGRDRTDMALPIFGGTQKSAQANTRRLFFEHGPAIQVMADLNLTRRRAEEITKDPKVFLAAFV